MSDRIDPATGPERRGPWPEVTDSSRLFDHGWPWCVNATGHPEQNGGYPDPKHHGLHECRGREAHVDGVRRELDGAPLGLSVYSAAEFRFGQTRTGGIPTSPRVVLESWSDVEREPSHRVSLTPGEALRLARILVRCADDLTFVTAAA